MTTTYYDPTEPDALLPDLNVNNDSFDHNSVVKTDIHEVPGSFTLTGILTESECQMILKTIFKKGKAPSDSAPVLFRGWSDNPKEEHRKLGHKKFYKSEEFASLLYERIKPFMPEKVIIDKKDRIETWNVHGLTQRHRFIHYS